MTSYRLYSFVNFYLSSIQQGIQTQHAATELTNKYVYGSPQLKQGVPVSTSIQASLLCEWTRYHKTTIVLNGGDNNGITSIYELIQSIDGLGFPFAYFQEDNQSLSGLVTSVAIVLPDEIYDAKSYSSTLNSKPGAFRDLFERKYPRDRFSGSWFWFSEDGAEKIYSVDSPEAQFLTVMKQCPLAR